MGVNYSTCARKDELKKSIFIAPAIRDSLYSCNVRTPIRMQPSGFFSSRGSSSRQARAISFRSREGIPGTPSHTGQMGAQSSRYISENVTAPISFFSGRVMSAANPAGTSETRVYAKGTLRSFLMGSAWSFLSPATQHEPIP
jgi:hypothetical protein